MLDGEESHHLSWQAVASNPTTRAKHLKALSADPRLRIVVAGNPAAPASLLEDLAREEDASVRLAVAGNPNTSWPTLLRLAREFPHAFLHNPVGLLQMLSDPTQINADERFWHTLLRVASIPALWWTFLSKLPALRTSTILRLHILVAGETRQPFGALQMEDEFTQLTLVELLTAARLQEKTPPTDEALANQSGPTLDHILKAYLQQLARSDDEKIRAAVAPHELMPAELLAEMARDEQAQIRQGVAHNAQVPSELLPLLALDTDQTVRKAVATHPQTPPEVLSSLVQDQDRWVLLAVAHHARTPGESLQKLAHHHDGLIREATARNPHTPMEVLYKLAHHNDAFTRQAVLNNQQLPAEIFHALAQDKDWGVASTLASDTRTPIAVLRTLAQDKKTHLRDVVAKNPRTPSEVLFVLAQDKNESQHAGLAANPQAPPELLRMLARTKKRWVRKAVGANPQTPADLLLELANDQEQEVRRAVATNPHTPTEALYRLARQRDLQTCEAIAANQATPLELLHELAFMDKGYIMGFLARLVLWLRSAGENWLNAEIWNSLRWNHIDPLPDHPLLKGIVADQWEWLGGPELPEISLQRMRKALAELWDTSSIWTRLPLEGSPGRQRDWGAARHARRTFYQHIMSPLTSPLALQRLALSPAWETRYLVALHAHTPLETKQQLSQDGNCYVRAVTRTSLA